MMAARFFLIIFLVCALYPAQSLAQQDMGVIWDAPAQSQAAHSQLRAFAEIGFNRIQVDKKLDSSTWQLLSELEFQVYAMLPVRFAMAQTFAEADSSLKQKIGDYISHFKDKEAVIATGLFSYGETEAPQFQQNLRDFYTGLKPAIRGLHYYQTAPSHLLPTDSLINFSLVAVSGTDVPTGPAIGGYIYRPDQPKQWDLASMKVFLEQTATADSLPVFFDGAWLQSMQQKHPGLDETLKLYTSSPEPAFALPYSDDPVASQHNTVVIALLLAWIIFAVTYHNSPVFRKSMGRYFTGHKFYVDDVMQRHIRTPLPGAAILTQHLIAGGILFYCVLNTALSSLGFEALAVHYPIIAALGNGSTALFATGLLLTLVFSFVCFLWLRIANPKITHFGQILNLYPWPLQINLLLVSLLLTLFLSGQNAILIYSTAAILIIITLSAFVITALDSSHFLASKRTWFLTLSIGLYALILAGCLAWVTASDTFLEVVSFAASFPK